MPRWKGGLKVLVSVAASLLSLVVDDSVLQCHNRLESEEFEVLRFQQTRK